MANMKITERSITRRFSVDRVPRDEQKLSRVIY